MNAECRAKNPPVRESADIRSNGKSDDSHSVAEDAVKELQKSSFDMKKLSVVGKDYHTDEQTLATTTPETA